MIAGLEAPDAGTLTVGDRLVCDVSRGVFVPPNKREIGMVFQSYAIWPHMSVFKNVAYPLRLRRVNRAEARRRVESVLELVGLERLIDQPATRLSGGQQQRVALARSLVYEPSVLLLDEPLSNLDTNLREQMRDEIRRLQRRLGITVIFVTHDQHEAMSLADRIVVMDKGELVQLGAPVEVYEHPATAFVRDFLGRSVRFPGTLQVEGDALFAEIQDDCPSGKVRIPLTTQQSELLGDLAPGTSLTLAARPEDATIVPVAAGLAEGVTATVVDRVFVGDAIDIDLEVRGVGQRISTSRTSSLQPGDLASVVLGGTSLRAWPR
jgi:ABC-type Fe3+/spermidine/putrescine transport system ATPase subunit